MEDTLFSRVAEAWLAFKRNLRERGSRGGGLVERVYFPRDGAVRFASTLLDLVEIIYQIFPSDQGRRTLKFSQAVQITSQQLKSKNGIEAFITLVDTLLSMMEQTLMGQFPLPIFMLREMNSPIPWDLHLIRKAEELELEVKWFQDRMETRSTSSFALIEEQEEPNKHLPPSHSEFLDLLQRVLVFLNEEEILILDTYLARPVTSFDTMKLVVIFQSNTTHNFPPPSTDLIKWIQTSPDNERMNPLEEENWDCFRESQREEFVQFLKDFSDEACCNLIRECPDIVALMPSVSWELNKFEPVLLLIKKCAGYNCLESKISEFIFDGRIALSDGRMLRVCEQNGWFYSATISIGSGISHEKNTLNEFGSLGAFAKDENGRYYITTCEHVIAELRKIESKKGPLFQSSKMTFQIPSHAPRKLQLLSALRAVDRKLMLNNNFLQCLLTNYENRDLKIFLNKSVSDDITLKDIGEYLSHDQTSIRVNFDEIRLYSSLEQSHQFGPDEIKVIGDLAAIPLPSDIVLTPDQLTIHDKPLKSVASMDDIYEQVILDSLDVFTAAVSSQSQSTKGNISRFIHLKSNIFRDRESSIHDSSAKPIILYNQYLVTSGHDFGYQGDSGGLVYAEKDDDAVIVGTFVGNISPGNYYAVTPAAVISPLEWVFHST